MLVNISKKIATIIMLTLSVMFHSSLVLNTNTTVYADPQNNLGSTTFNLNERFKLTNEKGETEKTPEYLNETPIKTFIFDRVIKPAIKLMGTIAVIIIIIGGFILMTAQGESDKIDQGKDVIKYAIIGLLIALFSYVIVITTQSMFSGSSKTPEGTATGATGTANSATGAANGAANGATTGAETKTTNDQKNNNLNSDFQVT